MNPKILGYMITWNNVEWLKVSLSQCLEFCDGVILIEGCHSRQFPKHSNDGTLEYLRSMQGHPKLTIYETPERIHRTYDRNQREVREAYPRKSTLYAPGNWLISWDDDMLFFNEDLRKIREAMMNTDKRTIKFKERRFIYNFRFNTFTNKIGAHHFDKIEEGMHLKKVCIIYDKNGKPYEADKSKLMLWDDVVYHHYPYVKTTFRANARWAMSVEKGTRASLKRPEQFQSVKWTNNSDIFPHSRTIEDINNESGFNVYHGIHPEIAERHKWRYVEDSRSQE